MNEITLNVKVNDGRFTVEDVQRENDIPYVIAVALVNYGVKSGAIFSAGTVKVEGRRGKPKNLFSTVPVAFEVMAEKPTVVTINNEKVEVPAAEVETIETPVAELT